MNNGITIKRILEYGDIFDDEPLSIDSYLSGISKGTLLHIASHFLGFKNHGSEFSDNYTFLNFFFNKDNREFADLVYDKIQKIEEKGSEDAVIVFHVTSLEFAECILTLGDDCKSDFKSNSEIEICVFKVYLSLNTQFTNNRHRAYRSAIGPKDDNLIARVLLAVMFNYDDLINYNLYKVFTCQFIRSVYFF